MHTAIPLPVSCKRAPWNKGILIGQKRPLKPKDVWAIRVRLQLQGRKRDLALFNLAIDSKLRGCDLVRLQVDDVCAGGRVRDRGTVIQKKTGRPVQFEITALSVPEPSPSPTAPLYQAIRSHRPCLGGECGARQFGLRHTFNAPDQGGADIQKDW